MLAIERKNKILGRLREEKSVLVGELAKEFGVSEETIRRDLDKLEKESGVIKTYGGALLRDGTERELPYVERRKINVEAKKAIAALAARLVQDGDSLILDASSTAVFIARALKSKKNITLVTNSAEVLAELSDAAGWRILSTGGVLHGSSCALVGPQAEESLSRYRVDKAILSCKGIDAAAGFFDADDSQASVKRKMLACAGQKIFAADASKFGRRAFAQICSLSAADAVLTDAEPSGEWLAAFAENNTDVLYPQK